MRLYIVRNKKTGDARIVDAANSSQALRYVAEDTLKVEVGKAREVALLVSEGVKIEGEGAPLLEQAALPLEAENYGGTA